MAVAPLIMVRFSKSQVFCKLESKPHLIINSVLNNSGINIVKIAVAQRLNFRDFSH